MAEGQRRRSGAAAGAGTPPSAPAVPARRRVLAAPANDNDTSPARRILRAAVFVAIGAVLAWVLRLAFG